MDTKWDLISAAQRLGNKEYGHDGKGGLSLRQDSVAGINNFCIANDPEIERALAWSDETSVTLTNRGTVSLSLTGGSRSLSAEFADARTIVFRGSMPCDGETAEFDFVYRGPDHSGAGPAYAFRWLDTGVRDAADRKRRSARV